MSSLKGLGGRLCNKVIMNLCFSILAEINNLYITYDYIDECEQLGINLFCGKCKYNIDLIISDDNYLDIVSKSRENVLTKNIKNLNCFFQTKEISNYLYNYLNLPIISKNIIDKNKFIERYNNNNDIFIHIRLGDVTRFNAGYVYYEKAIKNINNYDKIYISSDSINHEICQLLIKNWIAIPIEYNEVETIHFGSTCKNVILSHGSFSCVIGYLSFFSNIYYPSYEKNKIWYGDMFSISNWNRVIF
jgi:hypothetical protein